MSERLHNFSAGPSALPLPVIEAVRQELPTYLDTGASVMEISHRSKAYIDIEDAVRGSLRRLLGLTPDWHILFLGGGASTQFHMVPAHFLPPGGSADYLIAGTWGKKAFQAARQLGRARVAASSEANAFTSIPDRSTWDLDPDSAYFHFTSNNTVYGTQVQTTPEAEVPLVCDASSDFLSRAIDLDRYGLIYAGAQKNIGPAGVTVVLVRDELLQRRNANLPVILDYATHAAKCYNTPPVYAVYVVSKVLQWLEDQGGVSAIEAVNHQKAATLYAAIDATDFYRGTAAISSRSRMNVTFRLAATELEDRFVKEAADHGLVALKGHRSVGGMRASIYNACAMESVAALVDFMHTFERRYG